MRIVVRVIAGLWLFAVAVQGIAFLVQYGVVPLPPEVGRLDFTPQYTVLMALVVAAAVLSRLSTAESADTQDGKRGRA
jgi:hypothetical protein